MASRFLQGFAEAIVARLIDDGSLIVKPGKHQAVTSYVALRLGRGGSPVSLVTELGRALEASPDVDELFADNDALLEAIEAIPPHHLRR